MGSSKTLRRLRVSFWLSEIEPAEAGDRTERDNKVVIRPMSYSVFIKRAEKRMLGLRDKLRDAPFLREQGIDGRTFIEPPFVQQHLDLRPEDVAAR